MSFRDDDTTTVSGVFRRESERAILIETIDGEDTWIPKSCCDDAWEGLDRGDPITLGSGDLVRREGRTVAMATKPGHHYGGKLIPDGAYSDMVANRALPLLEAINA